MVNAVAASAALSRLTVPSQATRAVANAEHVVPRVSVSLVTHAHCQHDSFWSGLHLELRYFKEQLENSALVCEWFNLGSFKGVSQFRVFQQIVYIRACLLATSVKPG